MRLIQTGTHRRGWSEDFKKKKSEAVKQYWKERREGKGREMSTSIK